MTTIARDWALAADALLQEWEVTVCVLRATGAAQLAVYGRDKCSFCVLARGECGECLVYRYLQATRGPFPPRPPGPWLCMGVWEYRALVKAVANRNVFGAQAALEALRELVADGTAWLESAREDKHVEKVKVGELTPGGPGEAGGVREGEVSASGAGPPTAGVPEEA